MAEWTDVVRETMLVRVAALGSCELSIISLGDCWSWLVRRDGADLAEGQAETLIGAKFEAELAAATVQSSE